jgi:hypothetical protein
VVNKQQAEAFAEAMVNRLNGVTDYFNGVTDESEPDVEECIHPGIFVTDYNVTTWADGSQTCWCPDCDDNIPITEL